MKIRVEGTKRECEWVADLFAQLDEESPDTADIFVSDISDGKTGIACRMSIDVIPVLTHRKISVTGQDDRKGV